MLLVSAILVALSAHPGTQTKSRILIYTRNGKGYVHDNVAASAEAVSRIAEELGYASDVMEDPSVFTPDRLTAFQAIVFSNTNNEAFDTQEQRDAFQAFVRKGGGFAGIHSACASERDWPWFWALVGGRFVRHPALQPFVIKVIDRRHPATFFLSDSWKWEDECYYLDHYNPDFRVLLAVDLTTLDDPERSTYPGVVFGDLSPLAWVHEYEGARQFYTALGHKIEHYSDPLFLNHLKGGLSWVLGL
jgi:type 1 glutamine amidotransferase